MSRIENYRVGNECCQREVWDSSDIAEHCCIPFDKADKLHMIANKACGVVGYGDIRKEDFLEFLDEVEAAKERKMLQSEANAATIISASSNFRISLGSQLIGQALSLLKGLV